MSAAPVSDGDYPRWMHHPAFRPGEPGPQFRQGNFTWHSGGTSVRFPPVLVMTADDEEYYASRGYVARESPFGGPPAGYVPQPYPRWVQGVIVQNAEEEAAVLAKGPEVPPPAAEPPAPPPAMTALEAENEALKARIEELLAEQRKRDAQPIDPPPLPLGKHRR